MAPGPVPQLVMLDGTPPPEGLEPWCTPLRVPAPYADAPGAGAAAVVAIARAPSDAVLCALRELAARLQGDGPPILLSVLAGSSGAGLWTWLEAAVREQLVDDVICGASPGAALALAVRAKLLGMAAKIGRLREDDVEDAASHTVGGYRLGQTISRGAFGAVSTARRGRRLVEAPNDAPTGVIVISKRSGVKSLNDMRTINSFLNVLERLRMLRHSGVSSMVDAFSSPTHLYVAMELCGPRSLFSRLCLRDLPARGAARVPIPEAGLRSLLSQVCSAVCHLHVAADICHRDVKPEHVSIREHADGRLDAKLFGFELAALQPEGQRCRRACGTLPFAAPKVLPTRGEGYDGKAADMWSLGALFAEVACGLRALQRAIHEGGAPPGPRDGRGSAELARRAQAAAKSTAFLRGLLGAALPEVTTLRPWLRRIMERLLDADPSARFVALELRAAVEDAPLR